MTKRPRSLRRGDWVIYLSGECDVFRVDRYDGRTWVSRSLKGMWRNGVPIESSDVLWYSPRRRDVKAIKAKMMREIGVYQECSRLLDNEKPKGMSLLEWWGTSEIKTASQRNWEETLTSLRRIGEQQ